MKALARHQRAVGAVARRCRAPDARARNDRGLRRRERASRRATAPEVSLLLADDAEVRALNARWRGQDKPTNVLSFPAAGAERLAEAPRSATSRSPSRRWRARPRRGATPLADHYRHLIAHGFLHLIGYDHQTDEEAERMEALETQDIGAPGGRRPLCGRSRME